MAGALPDPALRRILRERFLAAGLPLETPEDAALRRCVFLFEVVEELYRAAKFDAAFVGTAELESIGNVLNAALEHQTRMMHAHPEYAD